MKMKRILIILLISLTVLFSSAWAQRKPRLAFEGGDLMIYFVAGYPKPVDMNVYDLGTETTDLPPLGGGVQISFIDYMSIGLETLYTYEDLRIPNRGVIVDVRRSHITALGKVFFHFPLRFFDPYVGGGAGWTFVNHDVDIVEDYGQLYWVGTAGFRLAFGNGSPVGIFAEASFPYPLIAGGLYVRFSLTK